MLATVLIIALLGGAVGASIWRYQVALNEAALRGQARAEQLQLQEANTHFWREREAANEYLLGGSVVFENEIKAEAKAFTKVTAGLGADVPSELALRLSSQAANAAFVTTFQQNRGAAAHGRKGEQHVLDLLGARESAVLTPLDALQQIYAGEAVTRSAAAKSAARQALVVSIIAGLLALMGGVGVCSLRTSPRRTDGTP